MGPVNNFSLDRNLGDPDIWWTSVCPVLEVTISDTEWQASLKWKILLDTGASVTLINRNVARFLGLEGQAIQLKLDTAAVGKHASREKVVDFRLSSLSGWRHESTFTGITAKSVAADLPPIRFDPADYPYLEGAEFSIDFPMTGPLHLDVILNSADSLFILDRVVHPPNLDRAPTVIETKLDNALAGWCSQPALPLEKMLLQKVQSAQTQPIDRELLKRFIDFKEMGIEEVDGEYTIKEQVAVDAMKANTWFDDKKKMYVTRLTWKADADPEKRLDDNIGRALAVCRAFSRKLKMRRSKTRSTPPTGSSSS